MNKWRQKYQDHGKKPVKKDSTFGELTDDADDAKAAEDIYSVAAAHRETVKAKDAAKAQRRKK